MPDLKRRGLMLVLSAPPGAGKTTISRELLATDPDTMLSISATTRNVRAGEKEGIHYYYVSEEKFQQMVDNDEMLEHALVYNGYHYGTPKAPVEAALAAGKDVVFDVDWQGLRNLNATSRDDVVSVFLLPPSWEELEKRMFDRARDDENEIRGRLKKSKDEISHYREFDYIIINKDLKKSVARVQAILDAERLKRVRLLGLKDFVDTLKPAT